MSRILTGFAAQTLGSKSLDGRGESEEEDEADFESGMLGGQTRVFPFMAELVEREIEEYEPASVERCVGTVRFFNRCVEHVI